MTLGGLSSLAWDPRSAAWVSAVDNHGTDPARIWFFRNLAHPTVIRDPLVLRQPGGLPSVNTPVARPWRKRTLAPNGAPVG